MIGRDGQPGCLSGLQTEVFIRGQLWVLPRVVELDDVRATSESLREVALFLCSAGKDCLVADEDLRLDPANARGGSEALDKVAVKFAAAFAGENLIY